MSQAGEAHTWPGTPELSAWHEGGRLEGKATHKPTTSHILGRSEPPSSHLHATLMRAPSHPQSRVHGQKLGARVILAVDVAQPVSGDVGIDFGGADARVAEQLLNDPQVRPVIEKVRRKAVA